MVSAPSSSLPAGLLSRIKRELFGLVADYWKDGGREEKASVEPTRKRQRGRQDGQADEAAFLPVEIEEASGLWHAQPGEISERMFGVGFVTAGGIELADQLTHPLGLNKEMNVLDLSAGLGARMRHTSKEFGVYITGFEPDPAVAARGMEMSIRAGSGKHDAITAYDPMNFSAPHLYDAIIARETFYRVADRAKFFGALAACSKPKAQISFTDYVLDPSLREAPEIMAWMEAEKGASPLSLSEMTDAWAKVGFTIRVREDQTDSYQKEVLKGLKKLAIFLAQGHKPDAETKDALKRRLNTWAYRLSAMKAGLRFYRFYGVKNG